MRVNRRAFLGRVAALPFVAALIPLLPKGEPEAVWNPAASWQGIDTGYLTANGTVTFEPEITWREGYFRTMELDAINLSDFPRPRHGEIRYFDMYKTEAEAGGVIGTVLKP